MDCQLPQVTSQLVASLRAEGAQAQAEQDSLTKQLLKHQVLLVFKTYISQLSHLTA